MKILGFDIATTSGWAVLLVDGQNITVSKYGIIKVSTKESIFKRLSDFRSECKELIEEEKPDIICLEDVIMAASGTKVLVYLTRFQGVFLECGYASVGDKIRMYAPTYWKSSSLDKLKSYSKKCEVILETSRLLSKIPDDRYEYYRTEIDDIYQDMDKFKQQSRKRKKLLARQDGIDQGENKHKRFGVSDYKSVKKLSHKLLDKFGKDLCKETSLSFDVSDAICIAYCCGKEMITYV